VNNLTIPQSERAGQSLFPFSQFKDRLVDLGLYALANGHMQMILALTTILQQEGLRHA
jgi:hypothetical protein